MAGVSLRDICRRIGADHVHLVETADGALVCTNSLLKRDLLSPEDSQVLAMVTASASSRQVSGKNYLAAIISQRVAARISPPADVLSQFGPVFRN